MKESLTWRCKLFIENREIIKETLVWQSSYLYPLCSSFLTSQEERADQEKLIQCKRILNERTEFFSNFRGISKMAVITMLSMQENPEETMDQLLGVYQKLKELFFPSEYLTIAAMSIVQIADPNQYQMIVQRTRSIYDNMKQNHPFLTSSEDSGFAALLALSDLNEEYAIQEMECCYKWLKPEFFSKNSVQSLSHILTLGQGSSEYKCKRALKLFHILKSRGYKYGTGYELATLGVLAMIDGDLQEFAEDMIEVDEFLRTQSGFGTFFGVGSKQRLMYAGIITMCDSISNISTMHSSALSRIMSLIIAQQAALCASAASIAAANANSNS